jgi:uncharacterized protein DUF6519/parallel beta helix pectate lyase-like protein
MSGDYTRFSFDPRKRYSGVLMQQGRVQLDSDWNEEIDIIRRRVRTLSLDNFGPVGVPYLTTPDAFLLDLIAGPPADLSIEPGRLYVDGILPELFAEDAVTYLNQPFYPAPPALPPGDSVVYLDVWEREVTYVEDPGLLDVALGGADTTTRTQTVWQLRVSAQDGAACGMPVGDPPSAGRLTTQAIAPPAPDDPCILPPVAGYRGLENRLYRVEIHDGGPLGTARFKWSRDNGSIVSAVTAIAVSGTETTLTVNRIGRDQVMRFRIGDWVTVTDDHRELMGEPGEMALIVDLNEADRQVVLDRALPTGRPFGANADEIAERHTRLQRWDETAATNTIDSDGLILTSAGSIDLEAGIQIEFSTNPAGGSFGVGDYWVFWARTATATIEVLTEAPPRGIEHHYVQLAAITGLGGPAPVITDCRPPPPTVGEEECCCTVVVGLGDSIQDAIDSLPPQGGCVCLKTGVHMVRDTVRILRSHVALKGESPGTIVRSERAAPVLLIGRASGIEVTSIEFEAGRAGDPPQGVIVLGGAEQVVFEACQVRAQVPQDFVGIRMTRSDSVRISHCLFERVNIGIWATGFCFNLVVSGNELDLAVGREGQGAAAGIFVEGSPTPCRIEGNLVSGALFGIAINDTALAGGLPASSAAGSIVAGNYVLGAALPPGTSADQRVVAIDVAADFATVAHNKVAYVHPAYTGIRSAGSGSDVSGNALVSGLAELDAAGPIAIQIGDTQDDSDLDVRRVHVGSNFVVGFQHGVLAIGASDLIIESNAIGVDEGESGFGILCQRTRNAAVTNNRLTRQFAGVFAFGGLNNRIAANSIIEGSAGIGLGEETGPAAAENRVELMGLWGILGAFLLARCDIVENRVVSCGYRERQAVGIGLASVMGEAHIEANEVMDTGLRPGQADATATAYGITGDLILEARVESNLVTYSNVSIRNPEREDRALRMRGLMELNTGPNEVILGFPIQIIDNKFIGTGRSALIELLQANISDTWIARFERVSFDHNYCMHVTTRDAAGQAATVRLTGSAAIVTGNHIKSTPRRAGYFSVNFNNMPGPLIGNVYHREAVNHVAFPAPENAFNILMP